MDRCIREIEEFRRKGFTELEIIKFILNSKKHRTAWELNSPKGSEQIQNWEQILNSISNLEHEDPKARMQAIEALGDLGNLAKESIPFLLNSVQKDDEEISEKAIIALGQIGEENEEVVSTLEKTLESGPKYSSFYAAESLKRITNKLYSKKSDANVAFKITIIIGVFIFIAPLFTFLFVLFRYLMVFVFWLISLPFLFFEFNLGLTILQNIECLLAGYLFSFMLIELMRKERKEFYDKEIFPILYGTFLIEILSRLLFVLSILGYYLWFHFKSNNPYFFVEEISFLLLLFILRKTDFD